MVSFSTLKKSSESIDRLVEEINRQNSKKSDEDLRFWHPETDKAGNGTATIRFLPAPPQDLERNEKALPWVRYFRYGFRGPTGRWYINLSPSTLNKPDPVMEYNSKLWNASSDDDSPERKQARAQKRKLTFVSNVYIISDPKNPENEGKVKLYAYGKKVFDKINSAMHPEFDDMPQMNPFNFWEGANFKLRIRKVEGYPNYDASTFDAPSKLKNSDKELEEIWKQEHSLLDLISEDKFRSYEELHRDLIAAMGFDPLSDAATTARTAVRKPAVAKPVVEDDEPPFEMSEDDMDDLARFKALAED